jgi:hypothetical protein
VEASKPGPEITTKETEVIYALVHSPTQEHLSRTPKITTRVTTQLVSATWEQIKGLHAAIYATAPRNIHPVLFMILDQQSTEDRTIITIDKGVDWFTPEGEVSEDGPSGRDDLTKMTVWRKYRCPFDKTFGVQCALECFGPPEPAEPYFVEVVEKEAYVDSDSEAEE